MFKRQSLPVARSIHYQLIDIQLDEVQQMVHSNDGQVKRNIFSSLFRSPNTPVSFSSRRNMKQTHFHLCIIDHRKSILFSLRNSPLTHSVSSRKKCVVI